MKLVELTLGEFLQAAASILSAIALFVVFVYTLVVGDIGYAILFFVLSAAMIKYASKLTDDVLQRNENSE